ncbi:MAG: TetR/AcrR family transcriptional regulator [Candidatus Marinimicrobia bacterium]|jgi:AcrR family transcriptional regulator|nr:TetR/AcrR family transcriptional regulator [Candidatus Neomarinimicrobiota bacterium]MBT3576960.1 TetR/AcrR family transcriptional regulator [Candidatus Neomarinimicrobiota bacterium]MBT3681412.1 TetR/AcrR family transcriptional regulator [Candidatus Neomarinimicrobiota bacterium]MBT3952240.1 TetR/AcrR family transcriptional regulator [Candidatus Neomarinimicrobiota bacterium]MBT4252905.1 TetR/AcrR family transcriptional regulator [Candidatus Neomarinimicrobiota bacterium]
MTPTIKARRRKQHRLEILTAAEQIFARQGYHTTTMEAVAEECGWSKGTLYLYFKNKEDLFFSILIEKMERFSETLLNELKTSEGVKGKVAALIDAQFQFLTENKHFFQLVIAEQGKVMHSSDSGLREKLVTQQQTHIEQLSQALKDGMAEDSQIDPSILAGSIVGAVNLHQLNWLMATDTIDLNHIKSQIASLFINGILPHENI